MSEPKGPPSTTQSTDDIDKNKVSFIYVNIRLLLVINPWIQSLVIAFTYELSAMFNLSKGVYREFVDSNIQI